MGLYDLGYDLVIVCGCLCSMLALVRSAIVLKTAWARPSAENPSGMGVATALLHGAGVERVQVACKEGLWTDRYDPGTRVVRLSARVFDGRSVASIAIASWAVGHAIRHAQGTSLGKSFEPLRASMIQAGKIGSIGSWVVMSSGLVCVSLLIFTKGLALFSALVLVELSLLPWEFDAVRRARLAVEKAGFPVDALLDKTLRALAWRTIADPLAIPYEMVAGLVVLVISKRGEKRV